MAEERFTDADLTFLRHVRFGELPNRVLPEDRIELAETEPARSWPDLGPSREQQQALYSNGA
ncbi:hypothetical protein [Dactylosporangium sp. NPDC051484]|uniref:hypothetical protein n=1 Tax=Dactylosporangium sp. NPDC051484 TaxID=3154942 RepID=UPI00344F34E5